jgi:alpha-maltose-1-phosphate synthase
MSKLWRFVSHVIHGKDGFFYSPKELICEYAWLGKATIFMQFLVSHVTGNVNSIEMAKALAEVGKLSACHTSIIMTKCCRGFLGCLGIKRETFKKRLFPDVLRPFLHAHPFWELLRLACRGLPLLQHTRLGVRMRTIDHVAQRFDRVVSRAVRKASELEAVYAYMDAAEQTFLAAKERGCRTIYELPTPYWRFTREIVSEEARLQPDWAMTLPALEESDPAMQRRDRELQLADVVIVPSERVRDSLSLAPPFRGEVHVVPYGCPEPVESSKFEVQGSRDSKLRVLYVGSLNQGKGLAYLAEAMRGLEQEATLTVIGARTSDRPCAALDRFLAVHRHRSGLSNDEVLAEMREHDVLVLPTLYEGLALVLLEAMACGLTVITTPNSGLAGLIEDGCEGFLVPLRDSEALRERLRLMARQPDVLATMRQSALAWSREHSWRHYRAQLRELVSGTLATS